MIGATVGVSTLRLNQGRGDKIVVASESKLTLSPLLQREPGKRKYVLVADLFDDPLSKSLFFPEEEKSDMSMLDSHRKLYAHVIDHVGLTDEEVIAIERAVGDLWKAATSLTNAHTVIDPLRHDPASKITGIRIAPFDASTILHAFVSEIEAIAGLDRTKALLLTFQDHQYFASFGRQEVLAQI